VRAFLRERYFPVVDLGLIGGSRLLRGGWCRGLGDGQDNDKDHDGGEMRRRPD
jgi:hypothetical protein